MFPRLVAIVLQQLIAYRDALHGWDRLVRRYGAPVPGNPDLWFPPEPATLAALADYHFVECGVLPRLGRCVIRLARAASRLEATWAAGLPSDALQRTSALLLRQPGVGPWTVGYLRGSALGDADAEVLGDKGNPHQVAYFFTGAERGDDAEMLRPLEPYRPHRYYVLGLLLKSGVRPPRRAPRGRRLRDRLR